MITDLTYLKTMSGGDAAFIAEMVGLFREQMEEYENQMPDLLEKGAWDDLAKLAHKAKSSVAVMGMTDTAELLKDLEILARAGKETHRYKDYVETFLDQCRQAMDELESHR